MDCPICGFTILTGVSWDPERAAMIRWTRCDTGCTTGMDWVGLDLATPEERAQLDALMGRASPDLRR